MRVLAWNILHGGGASRLPEIALDVVEAKPDVVVLSEFRPGRGGQLRAVLADQGLGYQVCSGTDPGRNAILLASRWPVEPPAGAFGAEMTARLGDKLRPRLAAVRVEHPAGTVEVLGVHIPDDSNPSGKAHVWQAVLDYAKPRAGGRTVIAGDTNSGRHGTDDPSRRLGCVTALGKLATMGYVDAWRARNPESRERTWSGPAWRVGAVGAVGGGVFLETARIDGIYVSGPLAASVSEAELRHAPRLGGHSDHSMVLVAMRLSCGKPA
ncbi:MAG: endonuclease/exonuclease/phosphatase family protein [Tepidisphaera sp.]